MLNKYHSRFINNNCKYPRKAHTYPNCSCGIWIQNIPSHETGKKKLKWRTITSRIAALTSMLFLQSFVDLLFTGSVLHVVFLNVQAWAQNENILHSFHRITCSLWNFGRRIFDLDLFVIKLDQYCTQYTHKPHTIFWSCHNCFNSTEQIFWVPAVREGPADYFDSFQFSIRTIMQCIWFQSGVYTSNSEHFKNSISTITETTKLTYYHW